MLHSLRCTLHVHHNVWHIKPGDQGEHLGIHLTAGNIIDDIST